MSKKSVAVIVLVGVILVCLLAPDSTPIGATPNSAAAISGGLLALAPFGLFIWLARAAGRRHRRFHNRMKTEGLF